MTFAGLSTIISNAESPVILLEGRREIPPSDFERARVVAAGLARYFATARFRSGNATGADSAFAEGVLSVDPRRLQIVAPYESHRKAARHADASYVSPAVLDGVQEDEIVYQTIQATPKNKGLIERRDQGGAPAAKAQYLIRDTMKVMGHSDEFPAPIVALFYIDILDPEAGGTGHTIRVCRQQGIPVIFQNDWFKWLESDLAQAR